MVVPPSGLHVVMSTGFVMKIFPKHEVYDLPQQGYLVFIVETHCYGVR